MKDKTLIGLLLIAMSYGVVLGYEWRKFEEPDPVVCPELDPPEPTCDHEEALWLLEPAECCLCGETDIEEWNRRYKAFKRD